MTSFRQLVQFRLPRQDKLDFTRDLERRGLCQQQVLEWIVSRELAKVRSGQHPDYAAHPDAQKPC